MLMTGAEQEEFASQFYSRQTIIREIGASGQEKLCRARVAVVGVGGLGSVSSLYLTLAGVGYIRVIDQDTVEPHNLHRQILYTHDDLHYPKAEAAAKRLSKQNPLIQVKAYSENVNAGNVEKLIAGVDVVVDGLDNMQTRHIVNRACVKLHIPYVFGAAIALEGNVSVFNPPQTGCLECLMPSQAEASGATCNTVGIIGATTGVIGSIQALETIKLLTGAGQTLQGKLMVCDFRDMDFTTIPIAENPHCPVCHGKPEAPVGGERLVWLCGKDTANINPENPLTMNLSEVCEKIKQHYQIRLKSQLALIFCSGDLEVSLFSGGRMLIKGVKEEKTALAVYREIMKKIMA
jgi:molybdopterin/thiamine biosynthesis adenylyltransferase